MDALKRTLIEKAGHDFGFEYTVSETATSLTLGSARHSLHAEIKISDGFFLTELINAKPLLLEELNRDFHIAKQQLACETINQLAAFLKRTAALAHSLPNQAEQNFELSVGSELKTLPTSIKGTEIERLVRQRVGQDTYRKAMLEYWNGSCAVTNVAIPEILRASHAIPWSECKTDAERLDVFNGFLLTANLDALFDKHLISFDRSGIIMVSDTISQSNREYLGLTPNMKLRWLAPEHEQYLKKHRKRFLDL
ncbi:HNH endonuclease [Zooshikella ganghwensis]|uniref:HNH endonuclease n=1 Tax=Zooshikella ganghwensis TaxID=202772 RepID=A0A4P9VX59_9GAMM|nr:HNH endonuclease signature motif containing protein [Zooshikella ganghwensis]RDH46490.1 HNH endonuclease [Zooshikella ganghwensis]